jgi:ABC-type transport system involved in multi-copper enzyme maturation permease subunit
MLRLVWKDVVIAGWFLSVLLPLYAIQVAGLVTIPEVLVVVTLLFTGALAFGSIGIEEVQGTEPLWCSLPVGRRQVVFARYATTALGIGVGIGLNWVVARGAANWVFVDSRMPARLLGGGAYALMFAAFLLVAAVYLPCHFRLGAGRGLMLASAILLAVLVTVSALGSLVVHLAGGAEALEALRRQDPERLEQARAWTERWGDTLALGVVVVSGLLFGASAWLAAWFYARRDC